MYLNELNDAQKALTLDLLIHALPNGKAENSDSEARIRCYCGEMGIAPRFTAVLDEDTALKQLTEISSTITLRKVFVELAMLAMSDMEYEKLERAFTEKYAALTGLQQSEFEEFLQLLGEIARACQRLDELVNEPV